LVRDTNSPGPPLSRPITRTNYEVNHIIPNSSACLSPSTQVPQTPPRKRPRHTLHQYSPGELGKWAVTQQRLLARLGWQHFFYYHQRPHSINSRIYNISHPTAQYLHDMACTGAPAILHDPPWSKSTLDHVYHRGPHTSAATQFATFLLEDMYDYVQMGYWLVLPYTSVRHFPALRLAPAGVVPQRDRRPRPIMDYSFYHTNQACLPIAPQAAMQFGSALQRILQRLVYCNPAFGPPLMAKIDLADGFYRIPLSPDAALALAVIVPSDIPSLPALIAIPLTLPMGWAHSPPYFCAYTETIADLVNNTAPITHRHPLLAHTQHTPLPHKAHFHPTAITLGATTLPRLAHTDVYMDDFMVIAQSPGHLPLLNSLLHTIDTVLQEPPDTNRRSIVSASKIAKGDATFSTTKRLLGWDIDTATMTITLPEHRKQGIQQQLQNIITRKRVSRRLYQKLLGTLRSSAPSLYGANNLFSSLQFALTETRHDRIRITPLTRAILQDWITLLDTAAQHAVPIHTVVPHTPQVIGTTDASKEGMGGCWVDITTTPPQNMLWRAQFPPAIQNSLVSTLNPLGTISNSDLELAAIVLGSALISQHSNIPHANICLGSDNTPAVTWTNKGSTTSIGPAAYLLHQLAQHRRRRPYSLSTTFVPGSTNTIADCCSRLFHLHDAAFLAHMNAAFPVQPSWTLAHPPHDLISSTTSALSRKLCRLDYMPPDAARPTQRGISGMSSASHSTVTHTCKPSMTPYPYYKSSPTAIARAPWLPAALLSALERWRAPYVPLGRRWPHWAARTHAFNPLVNSTYAWPGNSHHIKRQTHHQPESNRYHSPSSHTLPTLPTSPIPRKDTPSQTCLSSASSCY
jgi:hypothetical protein